MKIHTILIAFFAILFSTLFMACDSLWQIADSNSIAIQFNLEDIFSRSSSRDADDEHVTSGASLANVAIYNASTDKLLQSKTIEPTNLESISVTFGNLRKGQSIYATIDIFGNNTFSLGEDDQVVIDSTLFQARTDTHIIEKGINEISAYVNAVFLNPATASSFPIGDDTNSGLTPSTPVYTFSKAMEILTHDGKILPDATIYAMDTISYSDSLLDGKGVTIKKYSEQAYNVLSFSSGCELKNITVNGNRSHFMTVNSSYDYDHSLLNFTIYETLKLSHNTIITNSAGGGLYFSGEELSLEGNPVVMGNYDENGINNIDVNNENLSLEAINLSGANIGLATTMSDVGSQVVSAARNGSFQENILDFIHPDGNYDFAFDGHDTITISPTKTNNGSYKLSTKEDLEWFRDFVNAGNATIDAVLTQDIDVGLARYGHWVAIGNDTGGFSTMYSGTFDGQGHSITNIAFDYEKNTELDGYYNGLFGTVSDGTIKNVMVSAIVDSAKTYSGVVVGFATNGTKIINVSGHGEYYHNDRNNFGGVVGEVGDSEVVSSFSTIGDSVDTIGVVAGFRNSNVVLTNTYYVSYVASPDVVMRKEIDENGDMMNSVLGKIGSEGNAFNTMAQNMNTTNTKERYRWQHGDDLNAPPVLIERN